MKKLGHLLFTGVFMLACLIPGIGMLILGPSPAAGNEVLAAPPRAFAPDGSFNLELLSDASDYFSDHFAFRQELVTADSVMKSSLFATSAQNDVALGRNGWLFYAETLDDYTGADALTGRQAYCIARSLALAQSYVEGQGGVFAFTIAPNKASICPEYLPESLSPAPVAYAAPVEDALRRQGVNYADLFTALGNASEMLEQISSLDGEPLYFALDSHWTNKGAALGHDVLLETLGLPPEDAFGKAGSYQPTHRGDLHEMLYPASKEMDLEFTFEDALAFEYAVPIRGVDDLRIQTTSAAGNAPLLMFRDSFGNALHALMAESFSSATFSRATPYHLGMMEQNGAQYIVVEIVERNLPRLAQAPFLMPAPQVVFDMNAIPAGAAAQIESEPAANLPGYLRLSGRVEVPCDQESPVYVRCGETVYEAFPIDEGASGQSGCVFALYLPENLTGAVEVLFSSGGEWMVATGG